LEDQTCQHHVLAQVLAVQVIGCRGDTSTGALKNKRDEVARAEDDGICARLEVGEILAVDVDDAAETEVDAALKLVTPLSCRRVDGNLRSSQESRCDGKTDEVDEEEVVLKWRVVE
jgi:hypothetical protein